MFTWVREDTDFFIEGGRVFRYHVLLGSFSSSRKLACRGLNGSVFVPRFFILYRRTKISDFFSIALFTCPIARRILFVPFNRWSFLNLAQEPQGHFLENALYLRLSNHAHRSRLPVSPNVRGYVAATNVGLYW